MNTLLMRPGPILGQYGDIPAAIQQASGGRVVVLEGSGSEAFSAGSDITEFRHVRTGAEGRRRLASVLRQTAP